MVDLVTRVSRKKTLHATKKGRVKTVFMRWPIAKPRRMLMVQIKGNFARYYGSNLSVQTNNNDTQNRKHEIKQVPKSQ